MDDLPAVSDGGPDVTSRQAEMGVRSVGTEKSRRRYTMYRMRLIATVATTIMLCGATANGATDAEPEPTDPPLGPPVVYDDPVGDVEGEGPDFVSCAVSEPWQSLISFRFEFASEPPLGYDLETMTTDDLMVGVATEPDAVFPDGMQYILGVHGATLPEEAENGSPLYDTTQPEGDEVFWGVVDTDVDGPVLTLTIDRKLLGDPEALYFMAGAASEGQEGGDAYDACPDEDLGPGEYVLVG